MFWFTVGALFGVVFLWMIGKMRSNNVSLTWYEWLLGLTGVALLMFTFENFLGAFEEMETTAAWMFLLVTGLPSLIFLLITWQLAARRLRS